MTKEKRKEGPSLFTVRFPVPTASRGGLQLAACPCASDGSCRLVGGEGRRGSQEERDGRRASGPWNARWHLEGGASRANAAARGPMASARSASRAPRPPRGPAVATRRGRRRAAAAAVGHCRSLWRSWLWPPFPPAGGGRTSLQERILGIAGGGLGHVVVPVHYVTGVSLWAVASRAAVAFALRRIPSPTPPPQGDLPAQSLSPVSLSIPVTLSPLTLFPSLLPPIPPSPPLSLPNHDSPRTDRVIAEWLLHHLGGGRRRHVPVPPPMDNDVDHLLPPGWWRSRPYVCQLLGGPGCPLLGPPRRWLLLLPRLPLVGRAGAAGRPPGDAAILPTCCCRRRGVDGWRRAVGRARRRPPPAWRGRYGRCRRR